MADISKVQLPNGLEYNLKDNSRGLVAVSEEAPTDERVDIWINPKGKQRIILADIKDDEIVEDSTWSSVKIKEEIDKGGGGGGSTVQVSPTLTSGTEIAKITVDGDTKELYTPSLTNYLDKTSTSRNNVQGAIYVGSCSTNIGNAFTHQRDVSSYSYAVTGAKYNGAAFAVSSDGSASFQHKTFTTSSGDGGRNAAVLRFYGTADKKGGALQFAINTTNGTIPPESSYKDVAMVEDIPEVTPIVTTGIKIATIGDKELYAPSGGGETDLTEYVKHTQPAPDIISAQNTTLYQRVQLTDHDNNPIMPITTANEVLTSDGKNLEQEINSLKLTAGYGIKIENGVISLSDSEYEDKTEVKY